ncbi:phosphoenolpyruvate synthase [Dyadobacter sp. Leaf189]|uniref:phosphoenolpyruvate synthase n=1 Tax=Dyadobacter sp. Leaf189 TaxID=1736295 RepID=UPI000700C09D|nr:phosphoenolpyruvate synthase [Dyadobacter sp. Leaf189]KQS32923.1 phosphoenolpyruvate synthase [Dyadobacter sp. Leaf189]
MGKYILGLDQIDKTTTDLAGGKGAGLGELTRIGGIKVLTGFCVSTEAYNTIIKEIPEITDLLTQLSTLKAEQREQISALASEIRRVIEEVSIPKSIENEVSRYLSAFGAESAFAVRSSATAEDLPTASFAGQQDTYLNVVGEKAILKHISKCWASLFTDRAITYRIQNRFDHRKVSLAVIVQKMIFPEAAGILFTADPVTGNRKTPCIDASFGLGEAVVSGLVNADHYKVCKNGRIEKKVSSKKLAVYPAEQGGTMQIEITPKRQDQLVLTDSQILELATLGKQIEAHFAGTTEDAPQDIEWCLAGGTFYIVQSRPITTLFPVPEWNAQDEKTRAYVSVGHGQMMTDAMRPLGLSFFLHVTPARMRTAGGRLFVDVTPLLALPSRRETLLDTMGKSDPLIKDALLTVIERGDIETIPEENANENGKTPPAKSPAPEENELAASIVPELISRSERSVQELEERFQEKSGADLIRFILDDIVELKKILFDPQSHRAIMAGMNAAEWINEKMYDWLGEKSAADTLSLSVPNNVTSEMGLALLDVADAVRPFPEVIAYLESVRDENWPDTLIALNGGQQAWNAIDAFLKNYGMRCPGEIDITRTRWLEQPALIIPLILSHVKNFGPGAGGDKFERGLQEALKKEEDLLSRLSQLPGGEAKAMEAKRMIDQLRNFAGYREYPKYGMISRYFVYRKALLREAEAFLKAGIIRDKEDIYYFSIEELAEVFETQKADQQLIENRKEDFRNFEKLNPPRVITSEGEMISGAYQSKNLPAGAIAGLGVCSGTIEGRARVILNMKDADLEEGDILVTTFTDPSWTPLFVSVKGLITEVGGMMTHGAVIAREYGLPAVVGVENATRVLKDGQRIRVNGTEGYVEIL